MIAESDAVNKENQNKSTAPLRAVRENNYGLNGVVSFSVEVHDEPPTSTHNDWQVVCYVFASPFRTAKEAEGMAEQVCGSLAMLDMFRGLPGVVDLRPCAPGSGKPTQKNWPARPWSAPVKVLARPGMTVEYMGDNHTVDATIISMTPDAVLVWKNESDGCYGEFAAMEWHHVRLTDVHPDPEFLGRYLEATEPDEPTDELGVFDSAGLQGEAVVAI